MNLDKADSRDDGLSHENKDKLTEWSKEPTVAILKEDFSSAKSSHDEMARKIKEWLDTLHVEGSAKPKTGNNKNRSSVQPKLVRKQLEWRYAPLTEAFLSSDKLFTVEPRTWEDEEAAKQNELLLNYQFKSKMNPVKFIDSYVRTTCDEGTAFVKVGWIRHTKMQTVQEPLYNFTPITDQESLAQFEGMIALKAENPRGFSDLTDEQKAAVAFFEINKTPVVAQKTGQFQEVENELVLENKPTVDILDYNNLYIDPSCDGDIEKANYVVISFETSKAELEKDGRYQNLDSVNWSLNTPLSEPDHASQTPQDFNFRDTIRKRVVAYEYWGFYDVDGNGELKPIVATWIGDVMIRMEENPFPDEKIPVVAVPYMPVKKKVYGETDAELLEDNQRIIGALYRGVLDSLGRTANGQRGMPKQALDVINRRKFEEGEDYEYNPIGQNMVNQIIEHKFGEVSQSALMLMNMQNQEAESLTGVKAFTGGMSGDTYGKVVAGIKGALDAAAKREMAILRRMAQGMTEIGNKVIAMNGAFLEEVEVIRVTNSKFVPIKREDLKGNFDLIVDISTAEIDEAKSQDLGFMLQTLGNNMDHGMRGMILAEIAELKRMPKLAQQIKNYKPQPDPMQQKLLELQIQNAELENQKLQMEMRKLEADTQLSLAKAAETGANADLKTLDFVEQETGTKHARELEKQGGQARANQDLEVTKALLKTSKPEEKPGDIGAAIGYNRLTEAANSPI